MSERARTLHASAWRGVFYVTGGGTSLLAELLGEPGASRTVLDARVPYAETALAEMLGRSPEQACSEATARAMAMAAFQQARRLTGDSPNGEDTPPLFGLACTASLASDRVKRGRHRAHAAIQTAGATFTASWELAGTREEEEGALVDRLWQKLAKALELEGLGAPEIEIVRTPASAAWVDLVLGRSPAHATETHDGRLLLPGAFNPLHEGHRRMLALAEEKTGIRGAYELSVANVDKPFLDYREIESRLEQFDRPVWLTHLPTFLQKARHFPGSRFAVGVDTLARIAHERYYGSPQVLREALAELDALGTGFVVFGREIDGRFQVLSDLAGSLPVSLVDRCIEVSEAEFAEPVSSTELRRSRD